MAKVIGVGGIFIKFKDPKVMQTWYSEALGLTTNDYGVLFELNGHAQSQKGHLQLGTFEQSTDYFGVSTQQYMLNFRVDDLSEMIEKLTKGKTKILDTIEEYSYGKFVHIEDPEGNRIELWEPIDGGFENDSDPEL